MEFQELFKLLLRKKYYLIIIPLISGAIGFGFRFTADRMYISESQISTGLTLSMDFTGERSNVNPFEMSLSFSNLTENMASKTVVHRLGYKLLFHDLSNGSPFRKPKGDNFHPSYLSPDTVEVVLEELKSAIGSFMLVNRTSESGRIVYKLLEAYGYDWVSFLENGSIQRVGNTDFVNIRFTSEVPELSAYVVNEWAAGFIEYFTYQKTNRLNESLEVLSQILKDKQRLLDESTQKLNSYKSRYVFLSSGSEKDPVSELESLIRQKESEIRNLNIRLQDVRDKISSHDKSSSFNSRKRIIKLKNELDRLSNILMRNPNNTVVMDSLEYCRNQLQSEMYLHTSSSSDKKALDKLFEEENELELKYKVSIVDLQKLKDQYNIERGTVRNMASTKSNLENLETEVEQARSDFLDAQDRYNQARSQLLVGTNNLKMSYFGDVPEDPQSRLTIMFTALGGIVGFVITVFMIVGLELIDARIKNPIKFKRCTGFDPNGTIAHLQGLDSDLSKVLIGKLKGVNKTEGTEFMQTLRKLRFNIQRSEGKTFLFTSFRGGSGKSFLLTSLAFSLSLIKKRVLIVDTNFRNNTLSSKLSKIDPKIDEDPSGINIIITKSEIQKHQPKGDEKINFIESKIISETNNPHVFLMKSQNIHQSPEEIFSRVDFQKFIKLFEDEFDYIFLEGAALNVYSDTKELSVYVDYIVPVFSVNDEFTNKDKKSLEFLFENTDKLSLKLLNNVKNEDTE